MPKVSVERGNPKGGPDRRAALEDALRRRILTMEIRPGALIDEFALAEEFGLSRPPVRELLRQMAGEGYIELEPNRPPRAASMSYETLQDYYPVASMLYVATTRLAAEEATREDVENLRRIQEHFRQAVESGDVEERVMANNEFHYEIGRIARNDFLLPSLRRALIDHGRVGRTFFRRDPEAGEQLRLAAQHHDQIIDAIERHDADAAETIVIAHFDLSRRNIAAYAPSDGDEAVGGL